MLLIDKNNNPTKTVYYIAAMAYSRLCLQPALDSGALYDWTADEHRCGEIPYEFFVMALDLLFLTVGLNIDGKGALSVHRLC